MTDNEIDRLVNILGLQVPGVQAFSGDDAIIPPQIGMELIVADIDGVDLGCSVLEQAVGEAPGRCPDVQADLPLGADTELLQRGLELLAAPGHVLLEGEDLNLGFRIDRVPGAGDHMPIDLDPPRLDHPLGT